MLYAPFPLFLDSRFDARDFCGKNKERKMFKMIGIVNWIVAGIAVCGVIYALVATITGNEPLGVKEFVRENPSIVGIAVTISGCWVMFVVMYMMNKGEGYY